MVNTESSIILLSPPFVWGDGLAGRFSGAGQLLENFTESFFADTECDSPAFEIVVGITKQSKVGPVLLQIKTFGVDDGDSFFGVGEDLSIQVRSAVRPAGGRFGWNFPARRCFSTHGNAQTGEGKT